MKQSAVLLAAFAVASTARAIAPPIVSWHDAGAHVGEIVSIEGEVVAAHTASDTCVLEFTADDPRAFRAVLLLPLLSSVPRQPEALYQGRRVRATGLVRRFAGRLEMVLRDPGQIEVIDFAKPAEQAAAPTVETPPTTAPPPARAPVAAPLAAPAPVVAPAPTSTSTVPPASQAPARGLVEDVGRRLAQVQPCERARARWREAADVATLRATALGRCLAGSSYRCHAESAALAPALSALEASEQRVEAACP